MQCQVTAGNLCDARNNSMRCQRGYIIYVSSKPDWDEIWAINPERGDKLLVVKGKGFPQVVALRQILVI